MKKKLLSFVTALALVIAGLCIPGEEPVYAASIKISSAEDLLAMEDNPSGSYYLGKDITVPKDTCLFSSGTPFSGTLDGKGHKLKGYKSTEASALFQSAKFAEFKNLSMTNVDINVEGSAAALVLESDGCIFKNVSVSGKIVSSGDGGEVGAIAARGNGSMEKCKNSAAITAKTKMMDKSVGGLAGDFNATSLEKCSNSGAVSLSTGKDTFVMNVDSYPMSLAVSGLTAGESDIVTGCKNSGNITLKLNYKVDAKKSDSYYLWNHGITVNVSGICRSAREVSSSGNTGKIKVSSGKSALITYGCHVGGVVGENAYSVALSKCYNTGDVSFSGGYSGDNLGDEEFWVGGIAGKSGGTTECYNTGNVTVSFQSWHLGGVICIGGLSGQIQGTLKNCYNTGNVKVTNKGKKSTFASGSTYTIQVGGLAGNADVLTGKGDKLDRGVCNYSTGTVAYPSGSAHGVLIGRWQGPFMANKSLYYDNYYTKSTGSVYGHGDTSWGAFQPTAKKVSSITSGSCPKLSSKYWTYSSKHKRLILKNNKEK